MFEKELKKIGLSDNEAKIYISCLKLGTSTANQISKTSKIARTTCYSILENLKKKGIVSISTNHEKQYFSVIEPQILIELAKANLKQLESNIEEFKKISKKLLMESGETPIVKTYTGKEAITVALEKVQVDKPNCMYEIGDTDSVLKACQKEDLDRIKKVTKDIEIKGIYRNTNAAGEKEIFLNDYPSFSADVFFYDDTLVVCSLEKKLHSIVIKNKPIADLMHILFDMAYKYGRAKYHGEPLE